jgi:C4-dicarboxylate-specific signal transduction histidine kinase
VTDWLDRLTRLAALAERITSLTDGVKTLASKVEDHQTRLVRLETIIEIARPDRGVPRIAAKPSEATRI